MTKIIGLTATGTMLLLVAACSGATSTPETDPSPTSGTPASTTGAKDAPATAPGAGTPSSTPAPATPDPSQTGTDGQPGRLSVNEHCCYGAKYFRCPNSAACFGGFDIDACLGGCADDDDACSDACSAKQDAVGAPKGCQANVTPPAGVDCATGSIDL